MPRGVLNIFEKNACKLLMHVLKNAQVKTNYDIPVDYCEAHRMIPDGEPIPGKWRAAITPYFIEILNRIHPNDPTTKIYIMKAAQIGYTVSVLENAIIYCIGENPSKTMFVTATDELMRHRMRENIEPAIADAKLQHLFGPQETVKKKGSARSTGNTLMQKLFAGGSFSAGSLQALSKARSVSIQIMLVDEIDGHKKTEAHVKEGKLIDLFIDRTKAYAKFGRKIIIGSKPTQEVDSDIQKLYDLGDQRKYYVPCPHCGEKQELIFDQLKFSNDSGWDVKNTYYECLHCKKKILEEHKQKILNAGYWVATADPHDDTTTSYHISALYSQLYPWADVAAEYIEAIKTYQQGDILKMKSFTHSVLAKPWAIRGSAPNANLIELSARTGHERDQYNEHMLFCTMGVDIQGDRIEAELIGWGKNRVAWSIDYYILPKEKDETIYDVLSNKLDKIIQADRPVELRLVMIDSGFQRDDVYAYCNEKSGVYPVRGAGTIKNSDLPFTEKILDAYQMPMYILDTDRLKQRLYSDLHKDRSQVPPAPGTIIFPNDYPLEYYRQLTAEQLSWRRLPSGIRVMRWTQIYHRNETTDRWVYASAGMYIILNKYREFLQQPDFNEQDMWDAIEKNTLMSVDKVE